MSIVTKKWCSAIAATIVVGTLPVHVCTAQTTDETAPEKQVLTLDDCRQMAISSNDDITSAAVQMKMAEYDKKSIRANWFPDISVNGTYMYNQNSVSLVKDELTDKITGAGAAAQGTMGTIKDQFMQALMKNPAALQEFMKSPLWQTITGTLSKLDIAQIISGIGSEIDGALHPDLSNMVIGVVSIKQPVFMGGKIVAANKIATLAEQLSRTQYDQKYQDILVSVDQAYWQIISIANKYRLATSYADLLHKLEKDVDASIAAGIMTKTDKLEIKVKVNEADMMKLKAENGLSLSKMLLCKQIGLPLDSEIMLADEELEEIPLPILSEEKDMETIYQDRPEIKSLQLASEIYRQKANMVRAEMMPQIAVGANYLMTYPNFFNGFDKKLGGTFNVGVMVNIPIFHAFEKMNKTRKAEAEATLYNIKLNDARKMINLQVTQLHKQQAESLEKLDMARNNMENAEENLRTASVGFEAGVVATNTALSAHTAWLKAHSEYIDAGIELQMNNANLMKAEGCYRNALPESFSKDKARLYEETSMETEEVIKARKKQMKLDAETTNAMVKADKKAAKEAKAQLKAEKKAARKAAKKAAAEEKNK